MTTVRRIPKTIHYCWFGGGVKNQLIQNCMATWEKILPDYQIREWSEKDLEPLRKNLYLQQALAAGKWAFVSDVVRLYALYTEGGIYLDTDVEVLRSFNDFLDHDFFIGSEKNNNFKSIGTAVIGAAPKNPIIKSMLNVYETSAFIRDDGLFDYTPNTVRLVDVLLQNGASEVYTDDKIISVNDSSKIYPVSYFCQRTPQSYCVHHFNFSWKPEWKRKDKWSFKLLGHRYTLSKITLRKPGAENFVPNNETVVFRLKYSLLRMFVLIKENELNFIRGVKNV